MSSPDFYSLSPAEQQAVLASPVLPAPAGETSQLINPPNNTVLAYAIVGIAFALATIAVVCRTYVRFFILKQFRFPADWLLLISYAFLVADFVISHEMLLVPGAFVHQWNVSVGDFIDFLRNVFISSQLYIAVILPVKIAILLEWIRIFVPGGKRNAVFWASHLLIVAIVSFYIAVIVAFNIACSPVEANWNILLPNANCTRVDTKFTNLSTSAFNLISDVLIFLIPQRVIWTLNMSFKNKIGVSIVFAIGILACVASLIRLVETVRHAESPDFTYTFSAIMLVSASEIALGFLVVSGPYFPQMISLIDLTKLRTKFSFGSRVRLLASTKQSQDLSWSKSEYSKMSHKGKLDTDMDSLQLRMLPAAYAQANTAEVSVTGNEGSISLAEQGGIVRTTQFHAVESYEIGSPLELNK